MALRPAGSTSASGTTRPPEGVVLERRRLAGRRPGRRGVGPDEARTHGDELGMAAQGHEVAGRIDQHEAAIADQPGGGERPTIRAMPAPT